MGTDRGVFAHVLLSGWDWIGRNGHSQSLLVCVDNYEPYDGMPWDRHADYMQAVMVLMPYGHRVRFLKMDSVSASAVVPDKTVAGPVDMVYIDAAHDYVNIKKDIEAWWPIVRSGGILAGHDYVRDAPGVVQAVNELADSRGLTVYLTEEPDEAQSWYVEKP